MATGMSPPRGSRVWLFFTRRRRARTLAGGTRAFSSAYHRDYEATEIRTLKGCRNSSHPAGVRMAFGTIIPVVTLAALVNHRLLSGHASGVRKWPNSSPRPDGRGYTLSRLRR